MVIESPASRRPRAGARLRWSRPHVAPVEGPGLLPGLSIPWSQGPSEVPSPPGPATARTSAASIDPRRPPGASLLAVLPPVHRPTRQRCLGVVRRLEPCHVLNSRVTHARAEACFSAMANPTCGTNKPWSCTSDSTAVTSTRHRVGASAGPVGHSMGVAQDRASGPVLDGPVDRPPDGWRERHQDRFGALADYAQHPGGRAPPRGPRRLTRQLRRSAVRAARAWRPARSRCSWSIRERQ
jgi:hypothetical protein